MKFISSITTSTDDDGFVLELEEDDRQLLLVSPEDCSYLYYRAKSDDLSSAGLVTGNVARLLRWLVIGCEFPYDCVELG